MPWDFAESWILCLLKLNGSMTWQRQWLLFPASWVKPSQAFQTSALWTAPRWTASEMLAHRKKIRLVLQIQTLSRSLGQADLEQVAMCLCAYAVEGSQSLKAPRLAGLCFLLGCFHTFFFCLLLENGYKAKKQRKLSNHPLEFAAIQDLATPSTHSNSCKL